MCFIVVSLLTISEISQIDYGLVQSKIENSVDLFKLCNDLPGDCEKYLRSASENVKLFLILSSKHTSVLKNIHDIKTLHSIHISNLTAMNVYSKVKKFFLEYYPIFHLLDCKSIYRFEYINK